MSSSIGNILSFKSISMAFACLVLASCNTATNSKTEDALGSAAQQQADVDSAIPDRTNDLRAFCPKTFIRDGTEIYRTFEKGVKKEDENALKSLRFQATIIKVARECNYTRTNLGMKVGIKGRVINGPTGATGTLNVPIRVAIANPNTKDVVYSQLHSVPVTLSAGQNSADFQYIDSQIDIPIPEENNVVVYVGFDEGAPAQ